MAKKFNLLLFLFKLVCPLTIILYLLVATFGFIQPWKVATPILNSYNVQTTIMIGFSYHKDSKAEIVSRLYILIPSVLTDAKVVEIQKTNQESPVVSESKPKFYIFIFSIFVSIFGSWWFWFRKK